MDTFQTQVQREFDGLRAEITTLQAKNTQKSKLPDPEKFAGSTYKFDTWLPSIKAKLRIDGPAIRDSIAQFYYVYLNLESSIQLMQLEAKDRLYALRQGNDSLPAYNAKFECTLYEANGQSWPDINKISSFRNGLNSAIRSRLAQQLVLPRIYTDFLRTV
ncbi:uncharacterized protein K444DRAFT_699090 [Hyaloscypha bicolor E]|uniref:Retrotransposon gag domain-containing protein n=1 Tax=Hyaloscypha bicolor E TaxID=1095630 RepID=A0A2J6SUA6_9HELO|nr:uncharacterized protein K444DRAFT_699090 [Hyaloscypha bicolor E]PMD54354.1 hypothetical protein K444DRAFT_699090 [Hyaloscypha bicolor E]